MSHVRETATVPGEVGQEAQRGWNCAAVGGVPVATHWFSAPSAVSSCGPLNAQCPIPDVYAWKRLSERPASAMVAA